MRLFVYRIENYVPLITKISASHWQKLPYQTKSWIDQADFVQDGVLFARYEVMPKFNPSNDPKHQTKFSTYLFPAIHRFYRAYRESLTCEKRWMTKDAIIQIYERDRFKEELYVEGQDGMDAICKLYEAASDNLRNFMDDWFFSEDGPKRVVKGGVKFTRARLEFLERSRQFGITVELCNAVLSSARMGLHTPEVFQPEFPERRID